MFFSEWRWAYMRVKKQRCWRMLLQNLEARRPWVPRKADAALLRCPLFYLLNAVMSFGDGNACETSRECFWGVVS